MQITPWPEEMKNEMKRFGSLLLTLKEHLEVARVGKLPVGQLNISEIDGLLEEFEKHLRESTELERQWEAKQPELLALQEESVRLQDKVEAIKIQGRADYEEVQNLLAEIQRQKDRVHAIFEPFVTGSEQRYRRLLEIEGRTLAKFRFDNDGGA